VSLTTSGRSVPTKPFDWLFASNSATTTNNTVPTPVRINAADLVLQHVLGELLFEASSLVRARPDWADMDVPSSKLARLIATVETLSPVYASPLLLGVLRWRESPQASSAPDTAAYIVARVAIATLRRHAPHTAIADVVAARLEALTFDQLRGATVAAPQRAPTHGVPFIRNYFASAASSAAAEAAAAATSSEQVVTARSLTDAYGRLLALLMRYRYSHVLRRLLVELGALSLSSGVARARAIALVDHVSTLSLRVDSREQLAHSVEFVQKFVADIWLPTTRAEVRTAVSDLFLRMSRALLFPRHEAFADVWTMPPAEYADWYAAMQSLFERRPKKTKKTDPSLYPVLTALLCAADRPFFALQFWPLVDVIAKLAREKPTRTMAVSCLEMLLHTYFARYSEPGDTRIQPLYTLVHQALMHPLTRRFASFPSAVLTRTVALSAMAAGAPLGSAQRDCLSPLSEHLASFVAVVVALERVRDSPAAVVAPTGVSVSDAASSETSASSLPLPFDVATGDTAGAGGDVGGDVEWVKLDADAADDAAWNVVRRVAGSPLPLDVKRMPYVLTDLLALPDPTKELTHPERLVVGLSAALRIAGWNGDTKMPRVDAAGAHALLKRVPKLPALIWSAFGVLDALLRPLLITRVTKSLVEVLQKSGNIGWLALDALELCMACVPTLLGPRDSGGEVSPDTLAQLLAPYLLHLHRHTRVAASASLDRLIVYRPAIAPRVLRAMVQFAVQCPSDAKPVLVDGLLRMLRRMLAMMIEGDAGARVSRADVVVVDAAALFFLASPIASTRRSATRLARAVRQVGEHMRSKQQQQQQQPPLRILYVIDLLEYSPSNIVSDACKRTGQAVYLNELLESGVARADWCTRVLESSDGVSQLIWSHCVASIARLALDVCAPVAWRAGDFAFARLTQSIANGEADGDQLLTLRNYGALACATAAPPLVRAANDEGGSPRDSAPASAADGGAAGASSVAADGSSAAGAVPLASESAASNANLTSSDASVNSESSLAADDELPPRTWTSATLFATLLALVKAARSSLRDTALFALERATDTTYAELFECLLALERSYATTKRGKDKSSKIVLRIAVSRVAAYMCESMRHDALLVDATLRTALVTFVESTTNYLERHAVVLGDGREQLRCNLSIVVREVARRLHSSARTLMADGDDESMGELWRMRFTTSLVRRLFVLCSQWSRGLLNVVDLRPQLSRVRDVPLILRLRASAITLQWLASAAIGALLRQPLPSAQITDPQSLAHDAFEWVEALLQRDELLDGAHRAASSVHTDETAAALAALPAVNPSSASASSSAASSAASSAGAAAASAASGAGASTTASGASDEKSKKSESKRGDVKKAVTVSKGIESLAANAGAGGSAAGGGTDSGAAADKGQSGTELDKDGSGKLESTTAPSGGASSGASASEGGKRGTGRLAAVDDEPETLDGALAAASAAAQGKPRKELNSSDSAVSSGGHGGGGTGGGGAGGGSGDVSSTGAGGGGGSSGGGSGAAGGGASGGGVSGAGSGAGSAGGGGSGGGGAGGGAGGSGGGAAAASASGVGGGAGGASASSGASGGSVGSAADGGIDALFDTHLSAHDHRRLTSTLRMALENLLIANHARASIVAAVIDHCYVSEVRRARAHAAALCALFRQADPLQCVGIVDLLVLLMFLAGHNDSGLRHIADEMVLLVDPAVLYPAPRAAAATRKTLAVPPLLLLSDDDDDADERNAVLIASTIVVDKDDDDDDAEGDDESSGDALSHHRAAGQRMRRTASRCAACHRLLAGDAGGGSGAPCALCAARAPAPEPTTETKRRRVRRRRRERKATAAPDASHSDDSDNDAAIGAFARVDVGLGFDFGPGMSLSGVSSLDSDLDASFERAQLVFAIRLADAHRARAPIVIVTLARRMHAHRVGMRRRLLACMNPWLAHVDLPAVLPESTRLVDTLLWLVCRYPTEHWDQVSVLWQKLCKAHASNVALLVDYLVARVTERRSVALATIAKRLLVSMARITPEAVVRAVIAELLPVDAQQQQQQPVVAAAALPAAPPTTHAEDAVAHETHSTAAHDDGDAVPSASPVAVRAKKQRDGPLRRALALATRRSPPSTPTVSPPHSPHISPRRAAAGESSSRGPSPRSVPHWAPPIVQPEQSPYSGGYPDSSLERALLALLPHHRGPVPIARGHVALVMATELAQWHASHMREHLPQVLHHVFLTLDHPHALLVEHSRRLLLLLLHALVLVPLARSRVRADERLSAGQRVREKLMARPDRALWDGDIASLVRDAATAFSYVAPPADAAAPHDWLRARLVREALLWAVDCPLPLLACRAHAVFRALAQSVSPDDITSLLVALRRAALAGASKLVLELLSSLDAALHCVRPADLLLVPHAFWALVAMLSSTHSATYARAANTLAWLIGLLELDNRAVVSVLLATLPLSWLNGDGGSMSAFVGVQPLAVRGVLRSSTESASLLLLLRLLDVQNDALVQQDSESRLLAAVVATLPAIATSRVRALRSLEPLWRGELSAATLTAQVAAACRARRCIGMARALERFEQAHSLPDVAAQACAALLDEVVGTSFNRLMFALAFWFQMLDEGPSNHREALFSLLLPLLSALDVAHEAFSPHIGGWFALVARFVDSDLSVSASRLMNVLAVRSALSLRQPELGQLRASVSSALAPPVSVADSLTPTPSAAASAPTPGVARLGEVVDWFESLAPRERRADVSAAFFARFLVQHQAPPPPSAAARVASAPTSAPPSLASSLLAPPPAQPPHAAGVAVGPFVSSSSSALPSPSTSVGSFLNNPHLRDSVGLEDSSVGGGSDDGAPDDGNDDGTSTLSEQLQSAVLDSEDLTARSVGRLSESDDDGGSESDNEASARARDHHFEGVFPVDDINESALGAAAKAVDDLVSGGESSSVATVEADPESTASKRARHQRSRARARRSRSSLSSSSSNVASAVAARDDDFDNTDDFDDDTDDRSAESFRRPAHVMTQPEVGSELWDILSPPQSRRRRARAGGRRADGGDAASAVSIGGGGGSSSGSSKPVPIEGFAVASAATSIVSSAAATSAAATAAATVDSEASTPTPSYHEAAIAERMKGSARTFSHFEPFEGFDELLADVDSIAAQNANNNNNNK
jgi:hypothetical protein